MGPTEDRPGAKVIGGSVPRGGHLVTSPSVVESRGGRQTRLQSVSWNNKRVFY